MTREQTLGELRNLLKLQSSYKNSYNYLLKTRRNVTSKKKVFDKQSGWDDLHWRELNALDGCTYTTPYGKLLAKVDCKYGAPMGRSSYGEKKEGEIITTKKVKMCKCCGAYDIGGAYWGHPANVYVEFNQDLTYVRFYRDNRGA
jgi:hypothetical protein